MAQNQTESKSVVPLIGCRESFHPNPKGPPSLQGSKLRGVEDLYQATITSITSASLEVSRAEKM